LGAKRDREAVRLSVVQRWPLFPVPFVGAAALAVFQDAGATVESLPRPLLVALAVTALLQVGLSAVLRSRYVGGYTTLCVGLAFLDWPIVAIVMAAVPASFAIAARVFRRARSKFPWPRVTEFLNVAGVVMLVLAFGTTWSSGALAPVAQPGLTAAVGTGPDIYLILLDGHPRGDTMVKDFGLDSRQFLGRLERLGFSVADRAHSNYNFTGLTLASMFNMAQVKSIPGLDAQESPVAQYRALSRAINRGPALDELRALGYEIVTVPSPAGVLTLYTADRVIDDGSITQFEFSLLEVGITPLVLPDVQRTLVMGSLRNRVASSLEQTIELARERSNRPKFVFTHVMSPHAPVLFTSDGDPVDGWPCYPKCSAFDFGWRYGTDALEPIAGQIEYLDRRIVETVEQILDVSREPPIIIIFSDHGARHRPDDQDEMLRSLLVAYTPSQSGVLPSDASLVNLFPRLLNAYFGTGLSLTSEESYPMELTELATKGPLNLEQALVLPP
jgi:Sulfatase